MTQHYTAQDAINNYHAVRDTDNLRQSLFRDERDEGVVVACALGAAFLADGMSDAHENGCATGLMPDWLVEATPNLFDMQTFEDAVNWSDAVYARGGILDRASKLPLKARERAWRVARDNIDLELRTNPCTHEHWENSGRNIHCMASQLRDQGCSAKSIKKNKEQVARLGGTVVQYLDEALTAEGV